MDPVQNQNQNPTSGVPPQTAPLNPPPDQPVQPPFPEATAPQQTPFPEPSPGQNENGNGNPPLEEALVPPPVITPPSPTRSRAKIVGSILALIILVIGVPTGVFLVGQVQEIRERAQCSCPEELDEDGNCPVEEICPVEEPEPEEPEEPAPPPPPPPPTSGEIAQTCWENGQCFQDGGCQPLGRYRECNSDQCGQGESVVVIRGVNTSTYNCTYDVEEGSCDPDPACGVVGGTPTCATNECLENDECLLVEKSYPQCAAEACGTGYSKLWSRERAQDGLCFYKEERGCQLDPACGVASAPPPAAPPVGVTQCANIKAYSTTWRQLNSAELATLKAGNQVYFAVVGTATQGLFDKARFRVNGSNWLDTGLKNPFNEYFVSFTIPPGVTSFRVEMMIHHQATDTWY